MKFDRKAPGGGLEIETSLQNGKAVFQCIFHFQSGQENGDCRVDLRIWDRENRLVFQACSPGALSQPLKGMILHPHLWQGRSDAYLYRVRAMLITGQDDREDLLEKSLAFRSLCEIPVKGWFLNESSIEIRAVKYEPSGQCEEQLRRDLEFILDMGANGIFTGKSKEREKTDELLHIICDELGLILWEKCPDNTPCFQQLSSYGLFTDCYYYHKACWSKEPFVYISKESIRQDPDGTLTVTVYSNQSKVALYVEGDLFEFRREGPDFVFQGIPVKQLPILLTAETGACSMSLSDQSVHKMFTI